MTDSAPSRGYEIETALLAALITLRPYAWHGDAVLGFGIGPLGGNTWCRLAISTPRWSGNSAGEWAAHMGAGPNGDDDRIFRFDSFARLLAKLREPAFRKRFGLTPIHLPALRDQE